MKNIFVFTGSYSQFMQPSTEEDASILGEGICCYKMDKSGKLEKLWSECAPNPSYLALDKSGRHLYAVNELMDCDGVASASVSAYDFDSETGKLCFINKQLTGGGGACNLALNPSGSHLMVANYGGGSLCAYPVNSDGGIGRMSCFFQHYGNSSNPDRQEKPHVHQAITDNQGRYVLASDLGTDEVAIYGTDWEKGYIMPFRDKAIQVSAGAGPRLCIFNASGNRMYLLTELSNEIRVYDYDERSATTRLLQTVSTLPHSFNGNSAAACLRLHPGGRLLFASNRGHDSIAIYSVNENGILELVSFCASGGLNPRDFDISPCGNFLIVGNQDSGELVVFALNEEKAALTEVGREKCNYITAVLIAEL